MERKINYRCIVDDEQNPTKVIVLSTYAGKNVRGIAKCSPNDEFDVDIGRTLAQLRCDEKIAAKRVDRAKAKVAIAREEFARAAKFLSDMEEYYCVSLDDYNTAVDKLHDYVKSLD